jgi:hypothetical protein
MMISFKINMGKGNEKYHIADCSSNQKGAWIIYPNSNTIKNLQLLNYLNLDSTLVTSESGLPHASPALTSLPQKLHDPPFLFRNGLCDAHVPLNSPFFKKIKRTDIKTKKSPTNPIANKKVAISFLFSANLVF